MLKLKIILKILLIKYKFVRIKDELFRMIKNLKMLGGK